MGAFGLSWYRRQLPGLSSKSHCTLQQHQDTHPGIRACKGSLLFAHLAYNDRAPYCANRTKALLSHGAGFSAGRQLLCRVLLVHDGVPSEGQQQDGQYGEGEGGQQDLCDEHEDQPKDGDHHAAQGHAYAGGTCTFHEAGVLQ